MSAVTAVRSTKRSKGRNIPEWDFGDRLRKARMVANLQQEDIAVAFRVSKVTVSKWELGKSQPSNLFDTVDRYSEITGVDRDWLLTGTNPGMPCFTASASSASSAHVSGSALQDGMETAQLPLAA